MVSRSLVSSSSSSAATQPGEAAEGHVEDVVGLHLGELEALAHEPLAGGRAVVGRLDEGDDLVDQVDGLEQPLDDVGPVLGLLEAELRAAGDDVGLVVDVGDQRIAQVEQAGHAVDQRHHVHREVRLQRRLLVEVVEDHQRRARPA